VDGVTVNAGLEGWHGKPALRPAPIDQLHRREARSRTQVGEVALHRARPDAHELGGVLDGPTGSDEGREDVHLAERRLR
jgi:hypothetical protein